MAGLAPYLQLITLRDAKIQFGSTVLAAGIGQNFFLFALPTAWANNHFVFIAGAAPSSVSTSSDYFQQAVVSSLSAAGIRINSSAAQNWTMDWISIGN